MAYFSNSTNFSDGDQVTSTSLDSITLNLRLASDSADGTTITISSGVLSLGVVGAANMGANSVTTNAVADDAITQAKIADDAVGTAQIIDLSITNALIAATTIEFGKLATSALAVQADMQSETASKLASAATLKYHPGVSKAGGVVTMADGTIAGGYNISGSASGTSTSRVVTLSVTMANTNYAVLITPEHTGTLANAPAITSKTTTTFTIEGGMTKCGFMVFGQLA